MSILTEAPMSLNRKSLLMGALLVLGTMILGAPLAFASGQSDSASNLPLLTYTSFPRMQESEKYINNPHDVVTPWIEKKFNIKVSNVIIASQTIPFKQRYNQ